MRGRGGKREGYKPGIFFRIFVTAPLHPEHVIPTLNSTVFPMDAKVSTGRV